MKACHTFASPVTKEVASLARKLTKRQSINMHEGTCACSYNEDEFAIIDGSMLVCFGLELVDGLGKVSSNPDQQR